MLREIHFHLMKGGNYLLTSGEQALITGGRASPDELADVAGKYTEVSALLTHEHRTHADRLCRFCRDRGIPLYLPEPCREILKQRNLLPENYQCYQSERFVISGFSILPFPVFHDSRQCCGFFLATPEGDIGIVPSGKFIPQCRLNRWRTCFAIILKCEFSESMLAKSCAEQPNRLRRKLSCTCGAEYLQNSLPDLLGDNFRRIIVTLKDSRFFPQAPLEYFSEDNDLRWDVLEQGRYRKVPIGVLHKKEVVSFERNLLLCLQDRLNI